MHEVELKFQLPVERRAQLERAVAGRQPARRIRLQAAYFDTDQRTLAAAGLALRVRREGRCWVQTLKGAADDGMTRLEHNVARGQGGEMPAPLPQLHAHTPAGRRVQALLADEHAGALTLQYRTDVWRQRRIVRVPHGRVELALDIGQIHAAGAVSEVLELEFELVSGSAQALLDLTARWVQRYGLWLDTRTKAQRGALLARGMSMAPACAPAPLAWRKALDAGAAWQLVLRVCAQQILANASQVASGRCAPEHVHQLRVGLRRLRSALRLFAGVVEAPELAAGAGALFRRLGAARDRAALQAGLAAELRGALHAAGLGAVETAMLSAADALPWADVRHADSQAFLLLLLRQMHEAPALALTPKALRRRVRRRLGRWHRQVVADARRHAELDDAQRHLLRKRVKRLRYASEFCSDWFEPAAVRRCLRALRRVQDHLGRCTDAAAAIAGLEPAAERTAHDSFALGWLIARRAHLVDLAGPVLLAFAHEAGLVS